MRTDRAVPERGLHVPIIDLAQFRDGTAEERIQVAEDLDLACRTVGFMQVVGHAVPAEAETGLIAAADAFFDLPMQQKKALQPFSTALNRGYAPPRSEHLRLRLGAEVTAGDLFESFSVGVPAERFPTLDLDETLYAPNLWPLRPASFEPAVRAWFRQAARVSREVTAVMALALGRPANYFARYQDHSLDLLRLNNYRVPDDPDRLALDQVEPGAHTDSGIVTVLWADRTCGLQVLARNGTWHDVIPAEGALLVNLGDLLARWTNDRWISPPHRVLPPTDAEGRLTRRRSAAFVHHGNAGAVISCLPAAELRIDAPAGYSATE